MVHDIPVLSHLILSRDGTDRRLCLIILQYISARSLKITSSCIRRSTCSYRLPILLNGHILRGDVASNYVGHTGLKLLTFTTRWLSVSDLCCLILYSSRCRTNSSELALTSRFILFLHLWRTTFQHTKLLEPSITRLPIGIISLGRRLSATFVLGHPGIARGLFVGSRKLFTDHFRFKLWVWLHDEIRRLRHNGRLHDILGQLHILAITRILQRHTLVNHRAILDDFIDLVVARWFDMLLGILVEFVKFSLLEIHRLLDIQV